MKKLTIIMCLLIPVSVVTAQQLTPQVIASGGSFLSGTGYSLSQTICEMQVKTLTQSPNILTQGFQQPFREDLLVGIKPIWNSVVHLAIYPNPSTDYIDIAFRTEDGGRYRLNIVDALGRRISSVELTSSVLGTVQRVDVRHFASGVYFISMDGTDLLYSKTITFIKN